MKNTANTLRQYALSAVSSTVEGAYNDAAWLLERAESAVKRRDEVAFHKELSRYMELHCTDELFVLAGGALAEMYWQLYHEEMSPPRCSVFMQFQWLACLAVTLDSLVDKGELDKVEKVARYVSGSVLEYDKRDEVERLAWTVRANVNPHYRPVALCLEYLKKHATKKNAGFWLARVLTDKRTNLKRFLKREGTDESNEQYQLLLNLKVNLND